MDDAHEVSEAGRALAARRWGNQKVRHAAETLLERAAVLDEALRAQLEAIAEGDR